ncbi:EAL domain-containing protein [Silvimonas iriomotensis]|uniref:EAL domain-containing protein n=1 Tax=Silvimonas iriomotensis TaxID=449662 RepID=A0ABQ2PDU1_9NEIS|nr:EAL domain-containing protein [Silvimonas iriomotensis]GGP23675.1 hypothetical protein GCM10010970_36750 [Silvimonas iriomotensis]
MTHPETHLPVLPLPDFIRQDWPEASFSIDGSRGMGVRALGLALTSVFQPLLDAHGNVQGHEALLRASARGKPLSPAGAFQAAAAHGRLISFDRLARTLHLYNYATFHSDQKCLFLNVHPGLLTGVERHGVVFERVLQSVNWQPAQIVLEIVEDEIAPGELNRVRDAVNNYRSLGYRIAIDDFGSRHANLDRLWQLEPHVVKLDRVLIAEAATSPRLQRALPRLVALLHELDATVVVEGIETATQHSIARDAGADLLQGFYLGEPRG